MAIDQATKVKLVGIRGFAACANATDTEGVLRVYLLTDTPEVREAVLATIGDQLPPEKVVFEPQERIVQCSFCGKQRREVRLLIQSPAAVVQGKDIAFPICICDECVAHCAEMIKTEQPA